MDDNNGKALGNINFQGGGGSSFNLPLDKEFLKMYF
jgi:hypothetical protein